MAIKILNLEFIEVLSIKQQSEVFGGKDETPLIYCGYRVWYSSGGVYWNVTGQGLCDMGSISECEAANRANVAASHPGHSSVISYGCWNGRKVQ
jgi:hypothetical protein